MYLSRWMQCYSLPGIPGRSVLLQWQQSNLPLARARFALKCLHILTEAKVFAAKMSTKAHIAYELANSPEAGTWKSNLWAKQHLSADRARHSLTHLRHQHTVKHTEVCLFRGLHSRVCSDVCGTVVFSLGSLGSRPWCISRPLVSLLCPPRQP